MQHNITPARLVARLVAYFAVIIAALVALVFAESSALQFLPFGGTDALGVGGVEITGTSVTVESLESMRQVDVTPKSLGWITLFLATTLISTVVVMLPITWTYSATRFEAGPSKVFVRTLILMPICATTVVLLIQDSLALAFGLAALVAAVRFRVDLPETIDGIYIFTAICVGLAGGIGYMGVALVMAIVFTLTNAVLWQIDYGRNPVDDVRQEARAAKLAAKIGDGPD